MSASERKGRQFADTLQMLDDLLQSYFKRGYNQAIADIQQAVGGLNHTQKKPMRENSRSWPKLDGNNLTFKGKTVWIRGSKSIILLEKLIEARGEVVSSDILRSSYPGSSDINSAIKNLRKALQSKMPALGIEASCGGYRLVIKK